MYDLAFVDEDLWVNEDGTPYIRFRHGCAVFLDIEFIGVNKSDYMRYG